MSATSPSSRPTALVLSGGGARGAYEVGALSALVPQLSPEQRPRILLGTSAGALNTAYLAAADPAEPLERVAAAGLALWRGIRYDQVLRPLLSVPELSRLWGYVGEVLGVPGVAPRSVLDPAPLKETLSRLIDFDQIRANVDRRQFDTVAVVASSAATNLSTVFHDGGTTPARDPRRGIEYVPVKLSEEHVRASAAIPVLFPAVEVDSADREHWYFDGGTRLNTPIKPALAFGAGRIIAVALNSPASRTSTTPERRPDVLDGATQLIQAVLVDPLVDDLNTLSTINQILQRRGEGDLEETERRTGRRSVPFILIAPEDPDEIARVAQEVWERHFGSVAALARSPDLAALGRLLDVRASLDHAELLSYFFFAGEFAERLIELGQRDAQRWLAESHDDGIWQVGPLL